jgi:protein ImuB
VYAIVLRLDQAVNHAGREKALWREQGAVAQTQDALQDAQALFDRLAARLGPECVRRPMLVADHRPERAMTWVPVGDTARNHSGDDALSAACTPAHTAARPAWLLPEPSRLNEEPGSGRPLYQGAPLTLASRAERIEAGWFDGQLVCRDYHMAQARDHRSLWVFRERRGGDVAHWYLHGIFG